MPVGPRKEKVLIITHYDADGIASAAIVLKKYPDAEVAIACAHNLAGKLNDASEDPPDRIYILDLPPSHPEARELIKKLAKRTKIEVIDNVDRPVSKSASQLTSKRILRDRYLAMLGAQCDWIVNIPRYRADVDLLTYALRHKMADDDFKIHVARKFAEGLKVGQIPEVVREARRGKRKFAEVLEIARRKEVRVTPIFSVIYMKSTHGFGGLVAEEIVRKEKKIVVVMRDADEKDKIALAPRSHRDIPVHVGEMISKVCAQLGGRGGGHPHAAGGAIPSKRRKEFIRLIAEYIEERLKESKNVGRKK
jgi:single-stranded DNA-specific DHH superfamily exonuclease